MNGIWMLVAMDLRVALEVRGEDDWVAVRIVILSSLLGVETRSEWIAEPRSAS